MPFELLFVPFSKQLKLETNPFVLLSAASILLSRHLGKFFNKPIFNPQTHKSVEGRILIKAQESEEKNSKKRISGKSYRPGTPMEGTGLLYMLFSIT